MSIDWSVEVDEDFQPLRGKGDVHVFRGGDRKPPDPVALLLTVPLVAIFFCGLVYAAWYVATTYHWAWVIVGFCGLALGMFVAAGLAAITDADPRG